MGINQYIQIGSRIKEARLAKGIKQNKMAELLGISVSTYSNYENNYREPKLDLIHQICEILGIELDELLGVTDPQVREAVAEELLKDDIEIVKKRLHNMCNQIFYKLIYSIYISPEEKKEFLDFANSPLFQTLLSQTEGNKTATAELDNHLKDDVVAISNSIKKISERLANQYELLNEDGQKKADEQLNQALENIEMLTQIPKYQKEVIDLMAGTKAVMDKVPIEENVTIEMITDDDKKED